MRPVIQCARTSFLATVLVNGRKISRRRVTRTSITFWPIVSTLTSVLTAVSIYTPDQQRVRWELTSEQTKKRSLVW
jgi:hypothetical protein